MSTRRKGKTGRGTGLAPALVTRNTEHTNYMQTYRQNVMRVLRDIRQGNVNEEDLDKLQNFCQMSLALMNVVPMTDIQAAWRNAEMMAYMTAEDHGVVLKGE